jgi:hypothetical protein
MDQQAKLQAHINALNADIKAKSEKLEAVKAELKYALHLLLSILIFHWLLHAISFTRPEAYVILPSLCASHHAPRQISNCSLCLPSSLPSQPALTPSPTTQASQRLPNRKNPYHALAPIQ